MVKNTYKIEYINIKTTAKCFCPLGRDWYTNQFDIDFAPDKFIPDYCELDKWIDKNINGEHMIIEEAVAILYDYIKYKYKPQSLTVTSYVDDARHSKVTVTK